ncbi:MAG: twin-arginine translocase subunit TatC [Desulfomonile tiedjei]|nr:twin-arginine translocase subunit TatC [Desulfomonile tiedjei]
MSFVDHLEELRSRLVKGVIAISIVFGVCLWYGEQLFHWVANPITQKLPEGHTLVYIDPTAPFFMYLKVAFFASIFVSMPYIIYQIWLFVKPGLYERERSLAIPFVVLATGLFYTGALFAYFLVLPAAFAFFLSWTTTELKPMIDIRAYVSLLIKLLLAFSAIFETPMIVVFLGLLGVFNSGQLKRGRRYFVVLAFIIGAILTPTPDPLNQTLMAGPMILLYEVGIQILVRLEKRRQREDEARAREETEEETADRERRKQQGVQESTDPDDVIDGYPVEEPAYAAFADPPAVTGPSTEAEEEREKKEETERPEETKTGPASRPTLRKKGTPWRSLKKRRPWNAGKGSKARFARKRGK